MAAKVVIQLCFEPFQIREQSSCINHRSARPPSVQSRRFLERVDGESFRPRSAYANELIGVRPRRALSLRAEAAGFDEVAQMNS